MLFLGTLFKIETRYECHDTLQKMRKKDDDHDGASTFSLANAKCYQELRERERDGQEKERNYGR